MTVGLSGGMQSLPQEPVALKFQPQDFKFELGSCSQMIIEPIESHGFRQRMLAVFLNEMAVNGAILPNGGYGPLRVGELEARFCKIEVDTPKLKRSVWVCREKAEEFFTHPLSAPDVEFVKESVIAFMKQQQGENEEGKMEDREQKNHRADHCDGF